MSENTVFVIGAGASAEADLPTSVNLLEKISPKLKFTREVFDWEGGDYQILAALKSFCQANGEHIDTYAQAGSQIHEALPLALSIDNYIDNNRGKREVELCGKLAIVQSILEAEKGSIFYFDINKNVFDIDYSSLKGTWYLSFFQMLTENCEFSELKHRFNSITLIIFNYDRCIEHFLIHAIKKYYPVGLAAAKEMVEELNIIHPYGQVGGILSASEHNNTIFGAKLQFDRLLKLADEIRTFTEASDIDATNRSKMHSKLSAADRLIFLGFGFHELNMQLLTPETGGIETFPEYFGFPNCYASSFGIEEDGQNIIKRRIASLFDDASLSDEDYKSRLKKINIRDAKCNSFFAHYLMSLKF
tara:strand:+ start:70014 stop:71093 length:1080 start_codon:yes stop_codon:yes gene_type:complete